MQVRAAGFVAAVMFALAGMSLPGGPALADTIYDFSPTATSGSAGQAISPFSLVLTLADSFAPESVSRNCAGGPACSSSGNFTDFSLAASIGGTLLATLDDQPDQVFEHTAGQIDGDSGSLFWATSSSITLTLTWGSGVWNAVFNSDSLMSQCFGSGCTASGTLAAVPEPAGLGVFGVGLLGVVLARRRMVKLES